MAHIIFNFDSKSSAFGTSNLYRSSRVEPSWLCDAEVANFWISAISMSHTSRVFRPRRISFMFMGTWSYTTEKTESKPGSKVSKWLARTVSLQQKNVINHQTSSPRLRGGPTNAYIYIYIHIHIHLYIYIHIHIYTYTHTHIYIYTHIHIYTYTYIHIYIYTHFNIYIRT